MIFTADDLRAQLVWWSTMLGSEPRIGAEHPGQELWPVVATDGQQYFLKRLGPWRNLPVADQARVLAHLAASGIRVATFLISDAARLVAGEPEDSFVLLPRLADDTPSGDEIEATETLVGGSVARLHQALACYPWPIDAYREQLAPTLAGDLELATDLTERFDPVREQVVDHIATLPLQLVHGDLTPDNVLLGRAEGEVAFIDFDHLPFAPRLWDIGKYLGRRLRQPAHEPALSRVAAFLAGYHAASPLSAVELAAAPSVMLAANILEADWMTRVITGRLDRRRLPGLDADLRITEQTIRWQFDHERAMADLIEALGPPAGATVGGVA